MDNAAMVGAAAIPKFLTKNYAPLSINVSSLKGTRQV
jgi:tRNA A37 threonylcarbamoyltransferase TsaD